MSPHTSWLLVHEVVPRLAASIPRAVRMVGCEDVQELLQDATALAARMLNNTEKAGKQVTAGNIAYYTLQHVKSGRRSVGHSNADVLGSATQLNGRSRVSSFDEPVAMEDYPCSEFTVNDVFGSDQEDPSIAAARRIDWEEFLQMQDECCQAIVLALVEGEPMRELTQKFNLSLSSLQNRKQQLGLRIRQFMGDAVLVDSTRQPQWRDGIAAMRERQACRLDRSVSLS